MNPLLTQSVDEEEEEDLSVFNDAYEEEEEEDLFVFNDA
jgi:hypothetical protein